MSILYFVFIWFNIKSINLFMYSCFFYLVLNWIHLNEIGVNGNLGELVVTSGWLGPRHVVIDGRFLNRLRFRLEDVGVVDVVFVILGILRELRFFRLLGRFRLLAPEERRPLDDGHLLEAHRNGRHGLFIVTFAFLPINSLVSTSTLITQLVH